MENITQTMAKILHFLEDTQKAVATLINPKIGVIPNVEGGGSKSITEGQVFSGTHQDEQRKIDEGKWPEGSVNTSYGEVIAGTNLSIDDNNWRQIRKLEMPIFSGENPNGWLLQVERYFEVNGLTEQEKMAAIGVSSDGDALSWLQ